MRTPPVACVTYTMIGSIDTPSASATCDRLTRMSAPDTIIKMSAIIGHHGIMSKHLPAETYLAMHGQHAYQQPSSRIEAHTTEQMPPIVMSGEWKAFLASQPQTSLKRFFEHSHSHHEAPFCTAIVHTSHFPYVDR